MLLAEPVQRNGGIEVEGQPLCRWMSGGIRDFIPCTNRWTACSDRLFSNSNSRTVPILASLLIWMSHSLWLRPLQPEQYLSRLEFLVGRRELAEAVACAGTVSINPRKG